MFELNGYAAIVTGGARGIGRAIAVALADAGADVLITYKGNTAAAFAPPSGRLILIAAVSTEAARDPLAGSASQRVTKAPEV